MTIAELMQEMASSGAQLYRVNGSAPIGARTLRPGDQIEFYDADGKRWLVNAMQAQDETGNPQTDAQGNVLGAVDPSAAVPTSAARTASRAAASDYPNADQV